MYFRGYSNILLHDSTSVMFIDNIANKFAGGVYLYENYKIKFDGYSNVNFNDSTAEYGGAMYSGDYSEIKFDGSTTVQYSRNHARENGGAVNSYKNSIGGYSEVTHKYLIMIAQ